MILEGMRGKVEHNYPLKRLNTWKIGGMAEIAFWPENEEELRQAWLKAQQAGIPIRLLGRGSNVLLPDEGLSGITLISTALQQIKWEAMGVRVGAGFSLAKLALEAGKHGLAGLEFACGIPGTVGGGIVMNAGALGGEIRDVLAGVKVMNDQGEMNYLRNDQLQFGYRECSLRGRAWVLEADFSLQIGNSKEILATMAEKMAKRKAAQPLEYPNAGSVFRNPPGDAAGRLIEEAGWKGKGCGGAAVSSKHANFIINTGEATAKDVLALVSEIQNDIQERFGIELRTEIEVLAPI